MAAAGAASRLAAASLGATASNGRAAAATAARSFWSSAVAAPARTVRAAAARTVSSSPSPASAAAASASAASTKTPPPPPPSASASAGHLVFFDTTLRDGEQSPGCTLQMHEKVAIAHQLCALGVDVCEAGFPVASPGDFEAVQAISRTAGSRVDGRRSGRPMRVAGLARATKKDIDVCFDAVRPAPLHRVHVFLATSDLHLKHKLNISRAEAVKRAREAVAYARQLCDGEGRGGDVEFSAEDAGRSDVDFLAEILGEVIAAGATTINVPDTVGFTLPEEYGGLFARLIRDTSGAGGVVWSTHCHNDLGLATANTLAAVAAGARQVEVTVNGLGERAGNTALEEVVMAIQTRPRLLPLRHFIDTTQIMRSSRMVSTLTGMPVQPNKAIVGANAFAHESGVHQDGMLKNASTYEIMTPASVGLQRSSLVLGKHSGRAAFASRLKELGFGAVAGAELDSLVAKFKAIADERKLVTDADLQAVMFAGLAAVEPVWALTSLHVVTGIGMRPTATVALAHATDGSMHAAASMGSGPIDAVYRAIRDVTRVANDLTHFSVVSVTDGQNALGEVTIRVAPAEEGPGRRTVSGLKRIKALEAAVAGAAHGAAPSAAAVAPPASPPPHSFGDDEAGSKFDEPDPHAHARPSYAGTYADKDIVVAAAHAYVAALNKMLHASKSPVVGAGAGGGV